MNINGLNSVHEPKITISFSSVVTSEGTKTKKYQKMKLVIGLFVCFVITMINATPQTGEKFQLFCDLEHFCVFIIYFYFHTYFNTIRPQLWRKRGIL